MNKFILLTGSISLRSFLQFTCLVLSFVFISITYAQKNPPFEFVVTAWTQDEGLPQNSINDIVQTKDGYIWLATYGGLARFNGVNFTVFNKFNSPGLVSDRIKDLLEDNEGGLWIGTEDGVSYYKNGSFKTFTEKDGFTMYNDVKIMMDKKGTVWLFVMPVFYQFKDGRFYKKEIINDENLRMRAYNGEADFFVPFKNKICAVIDNKAINFFTNFEHPGSDFWSIVEYPKGTIWATTYNVGLYKLELNKVRHYTTSDGLVSNSLRRLLIDSDKLLWITGENGINYIYNNKIYSVSPEHGLPNAINEIIVQDNEKNYWIGTWNSGIYQMRKSIISNYGKKDGLLTESIFSLSLQQNGDLLIGLVGGIFNLHNKKILPSPLNKFLKQTTVNAIFEDSQKRIWIDNFGLSFFNIDGKLTYVKSDDYNPHDINAFYEDKDGAIWVGCGSGLYKYYNNDLIYYSIKDGLSSNNVHCILKDKNENIWVGTTNGLNKISNGKVGAINSIPGLHNNYFRAIYQDGEGVVWFGTYGGGLVRYKDNKFFVFTTDNGLFDNVVSQIVEDDYGYFWMGSNRGIQRIRKSDLNDYAEGKMKSFFVSTFGKYEGMESAETNGGFQPSAVKDKNGNIYFPTVKGIVVIDTKSLNVNSRVPPVYIENVLVAGESRKNNDVEIPYDSSNVEITYNVLSYTAPSKIQSKYIMEGYDKDWNNGGNLRYARYTNLPPGDYTFKVIAANNDNVWNEEGASIAITVLPPFWMTWWFRSIIILLFISVGPIIYYRRVRALKIEQIRQHEFSGKLIESQEAERKRIAAELHDGLGQNLLIIKNKLALGLNSSSGEETKNKISEAESFIVNSIQEVRTISKNLSPHLLDQLGLTSALETMIENVQESSGISFTVNMDNIDGLFDEKLETNIYRIVQESLNNIIKHSGAGRVKIDIAKTNEMIEIIVKDNGKGIDMNNEKIQKGFGLAGIKERTRILGGELQINSQENEGTELKLQIPVNIK